MNRKVTQIKHDYVMLNLTKHDYTCINFVCLASYNNWTSET